MQKVINALIGPSGCGKSTFLKTLNRMQDLEVAKKVMAHDDVVDDYFTKVKTGIIDLVAAEPSQGEYALDLLMIAKYFERIGDHCTNIAEWVEFSVTAFIRIASK